MTDKITCDMKAIVSKIENKSEHTENLQKARNYQLFYHKSNSLLDTSQYLQFS